MSELIVLLMVLNIPPSDWPAAVAPAAIAREISPTIRPYSSALDPLSSLTKRSTMA
jgi:hypothetical protein